MSHLALIPSLQTLPGWPEAYVPGAMDILTVILFVPAAIAAVFAFITLGPAWFRRSQQRGAELERA